MQSYKVILNGIRAALDGLTGKINRLREDFTSLAWVPIMETKVKELWSEELTKIYTEVESGFPTLVAGKKYTVTIGEDQYSVTAVAKAVGEVYGICIGNLAYFDEVEDTGEPFVVVNAGGMAIIGVVKECIGKTMTISLLTEVAGSELEYLKDYIDRKDAESAAVNIEFYKKDYSSGITCNLTPAQILALTPEELGRASVNYNYLGFFQFQLMASIKTPNDGLAFLFLDNGTISDVSTSWRYVECISVTADGFEFDDFGRFPAVKSRAASSYNPYGFVGYDGQTDSTNNMRFGSIDSDSYTIPDLKAKLDTAVINGATEMSLTSPSGKVFTITVADDGTLTATEAST